MQAQRKRAPVSGLAPAGALTEMEVSAMQTIAPTGAMDDRTKSLMDALDGQVTVLTVALAQWADRDDSRPQPEVREAANTAMDALNTMSAKLHGTRAMLAAEIRASDQATDARIDAMLAVPLNERLAARIHGVSA